jgi:hypothetical protein
MNRRRSSSALSSGMQKEALRGASITTQLDELRYKYTGDSSENQREKPDRRLRRGCMNIDGMPIRDTGRKQR